MNVNELEKTKAALLEQIKNVEQIRSFFFTPFALPLAPVAPLVALINKSALSSAMEELKRVEGELSERKLAEARSREAESRKLGTPPEPAVYRF